MEVSLEDIAVSDKTPVVIIELVKLLITVYYFLMCNRLCSILFYSVNIAFHFIKKYSYFQCLYKKKTLNHSKTEHEKINATPNHRQ